MADVLSILSIFAGIIFIGFLAEIFFRKSRVPDVIWLIIIGILLNSVFHLINPADLGIGATIFVNIALILLLFQGAINLDFKTIFASLRSASLLTVLSFFLTSIVTAGLGIVLLKLPFNLALLFGMTLGGTSSAVVIPLANSLPLSQKIRSTLTIESAISDVLCIVGTITIMTIMTTGEITGTGVVSSLISSFSLALLFGIVIGLIWIFLMGKHRNLANGEMVTVAAIMLLFAVIESPYIGASGAIAVLAFGLVLGNSKPILEFFNQKVHETEPMKTNIITSSSKNFYGEISFFVKVFFFVYLGILIDFSEPQLLWWALIIAIAAFFIRPLAVKIVFWKNDFTPIDRTALEILIAKGLAAAVIVSIAIEKAVPGAETIVNPVLYVIFLSIVITAILIFLNGRGRYNGIETVNVLGKKLLHKNAENESSTEES